MPLTVQGLPSTSRHHDGLAPATRTLPSAGPSAHRAPGSAGGVVGGWVGGGLGVVPVPSVPKTWSSSREYPYPVPRFVAAMRT